MVELILSDNHPNIVSVRLGETAWVVYGLGGESSSDFSAVCIISGVLHFRYENWSIEDSEASSNYKELKNLVVTLERLFE